MGKTTDRLYGCSPLEFADLSYREALQYKKRKAKELLYKLMEEGYQTRDDERVNDVAAAQKWVDELIIEIEESEDETK